MLTLTSLNSILDQGYMEFRHAPKTRKYCLTPTNMKVISIVSKSEGGGALLIMPKRKVPLATLGFPKHFKIRVTT